MPGRRSTVLMSAAVVLGFALLLAPSHAQSDSCTPTWLPTFGGQPGMDQVVYDCLVFDDGSGPALYAAGRFKTAGGVPANNVARWNGEHWEALGSGMSNAVYALAVFDDGSGAGPQLYAGGGFGLLSGVQGNGLAKWDGSSWSIVGDASMWVFSLLVFDDGSGPALFVGGSFEDAGGTPANHIAKWDGSQWSALGSGVAALAPPKSTEVMTLAAFDDGSGPALYAGGTFLSVGGQPASHIARWDGTAWSALGSGVSGVVSEYDIEAVRTLAVHDDGSGPKLYVGGGFLQAGGAPASYLASWDGTSWSDVGGGTSGEVYRLASLDDGSGPALHAGGYFSAAGGVPASGIARWDGTAWSALGSGLYGAAEAFAAFDDGSGPAIFVGGSFGDAGDTGALNIARWDGAAWSSLEHGLNHSVMALLDYDDGSGPALVAGGRFSHAGGVELNCIGRWDGASWESLGGGVMSDGFSTTLIEGLAVFDSGTGPDLIACGSFATAGGVPAQHIARWDGTSWWPLGEGVSNSPRELAVVDDGHGPALFVGGGLHLAGGQPVKHIARWDGTSWSSPAGGMDNGVGALAVFDDGSGGGPALFAGGGFLKAGDVPCNRVAKWNGTSWLPLGAGCDGWVDSMAVFDDGGGPALYVGGQFATAGGGPASHIARWNGGSWSALGAGLEGGRVKALAVLDDGNGLALYAGGEITAAGGLPVANLARWDGSSWSAVDSGVAGDVWALLAFDDGDGGSLFVGGDFASVPGCGDSFLARRSGCPVSPSAWSHLGYALPGVAGPPRLYGSGSLVGGQPVALDLMHAAPSAPAGLFVALASAPQAFKGGTLLPVPTLLTLPLATSPAGRIKLALAWPAGLPPGLTVYYQYAIEDAAAVQGIALSNALMSVTP